MKENDKNTDLNIDGFDFAGLADELAKEVNQEMEEGPKDSIEKSAKEEKKADEFVLNMDGMFDEDGEEIEVDDEFEEISEDDDIEEYDYSDEYEDFDITDSGEKKKLPKWLKVSIIVFCITFIIMLPVLYFGGRFLGIFTDFSNQKEQEEEFDYVESAAPDAVVIDQDEIDWSNAIKGSARYNENVVNILLLGEDGQSDQDYRGNSDTMIIFTINKEKKTVKMTSIMRDLYVRIPEHSDNKINAAYCTGGVDLIKRTIEENFKVSIDYTIVVQFDTYKAVIDALGGVDVEINEEEAEYINMKCESSGSNLSAGKVHLDGRQCLWFSRIRKIDSDIYGCDDFGRTARQRTVLTQIFNRYKDLNYLEIAKLANSVLDYVQTDLDPSTLVKCAALVMSYKVDNLDTLRIPMDNCFEFASVYFESINMYLEVIMLDKYTEENVDALHMFIYGDINY